MTERDERDVVEGVTPYFLRQDPLPETVQARFRGYSRLGTGRVVNEDHFAVLQLGRSQETLQTSLPDSLIAQRFDEFGYAVIVADGLGTNGGGTGEAASHLAIATLVQLAKHFGRWNLRIDDAVALQIMARAERFYRHVDSAVAHQQRVSGVNTAQAAMTAVFGAGRDLFFAHVGHSRAYLFRNQELMRLTRDHTIGPNGPMKAPIGPMLDVNTAARDLKHILTNTLGMSGPVGPSIDLERVQLDDRDRVLVCTNGVTDYVDEHDIGSVLASGDSPDDQCRALADLAVDSGGEDDATAVVGWYSIPK